MSQFTPIDLSKLPPPKVVEQLSFETIFQALRNRYIELNPDHTALLESDPSYKLLEAAAWEEFLKRQDFNEHCHDVMLAFASGSDLDQLAANRGLVRELVSPGDAAAIPPLPPVYEDDERLRRRIQLAPEAETTAGSEGSYLFYALGASVEVKDAAVDSPAPCQVRVTVLSTAGDGTPAPTLLAQVAAALSPADVRPLNDEVLVQASAITTYAVSATLYYFDGPSSGPVRAAADAALRKYVGECHAIGRSVAHSGLLAALHQPGVAKVVLAAPGADIPAAPRTAPYCTALTLTDGGVSA